MKNSAWLVVALISVASVGSGASRALADEPPAATDSSEPRRVPLEVGMVAPDFTLPSSTGESVELSSFKGKQTVVLYFYPKDNTPGCTKEAQDFRDDYERFKRAGAAVLGVSVDDLSSHKGFSHKNTLNFPLLADAGGKVARQYGVMGWIMAKRVTYVIGRDGKIKFVDGEVDANLPAHSKKVLSFVQGMGSAPVKSKGKNPPSPH